MWKNELDSIRAEWQEDVEDKEKKIKLLQTAMQVQNITIEDCLILILRLLTILVNFITQYWILQVD